MVVVVSRSTITRSAPYRVFESSTSSSLTPSWSGDDAVPPVRTAMSWSMRLAPVAESRGLTATLFSTAANLIEDQRGQRLVLDVLGDEQDGLAALREAFQKRQQVLQDRRACGR